MSFNPNASEWKPSVSASAWTPGQGFTAPAPAPAPTPAPAPAPPAREESQESDIDENDPLWKLVLKIAGGDRERAVKMISDPDSLTQYPEVEALLASMPAEDDAMDTAQDDWESEQLAKEMDSKMAIDEDKKPAAPKEPEEEEEDEVIEVDDAPEGDPREHLNLVFIGHVDAGKSTLSGNILYITENVDKRTIERYEREAKERNRESWFLAFIMDTNEEERAKGKTVEVGRAHFETEVKRYTILDAPGHKNYVPNMIMGASQADIGVLVISARKGEFETGFDRGGQTREHALLAKTLGVSYLVVVINKMDDPTVQWEKQRFDECVTKLRPFLKSCGFVIKREVKFIPISGLTGANIKDTVSPSVCPWWSKCVANADNNTPQPTLMSLLDSLELKGRDPDAPLRIPVLDRYTDRGTIAMGKVESGTVRPGQKVVLMPTRNVYKIDAVWANEEPVKCARPGENVLIKLGGGCGVEDILKGFVICTNPPCRAVSKLICDIALMDLPEHARIFTAGFQSMFHAHCCEEECTVTKIFETTNSKGQVQKLPRFANVGMRIVCMIEVARSVPIETFEDKPFLGRFTLRTEGKTVAIGKIKKLPPKKD
uniref:Tr-type G domain-containing protein n=1 Tax=Ditylum brightwellii TaxID=49249 RepID=A0A7S2EUT7_9STRA|mmetsp:Transcript_8745/g.13033  ORF Transcript_8745/g.13033 Transcript_8745/m.13033 type:complete len:600 (+) Transcript_8745:72-1871(+)